MKSWAQDIQKAEAHMSTGTKWDENRAEREAALAHGVLAIAKVMAAMYEDQRRETA